MRKLSMSTHLAVRTIYVVGKQFLTIFILSHTIGVIFYIIDFTLVNEPICQNDNSRKKNLIKFVGYTLRLPTHLSFNMSGKYSTFTLYIGELTQLHLSVMEI